MFLKTIGLATPVVLGGLYVSGSFGGNYSREVDRPPAEVMAALADLDIREQPGAPGTDPSRAGGVMPLFRQERTADTMTWWVMSGDKVAVRMTAALEPIDDGRATRVTAQVERGDAPDDFVSPAFRSEGLTMGLFGMALEAELDELSHAAGDPAKCRELMARFESGALASAGDRPREGVVNAMGATATTIVKLHAFEGELRRNGCETSQSASLFRQPTSRMGAAPPRREGNISFEPGKPMVDLSSSR